MPGRQIERMMGDDNPDGRGRCRTQARRRAGDLRLVQPAAAVKRQRARAVEPNRNHLRVLEYRLQILGDVAAIAAVRIQQPRRHVEERHVVVAGDDESRGRQLIEKGSRLLELAAPGALREVARDCDEIRSDLVDRADERLHEPRVDAAEMNVGEMHDGPHRVSSEAAPRAARLDAFDSGAVCSWS